jgi:hypothetical protein
MERESPTVIVGMGEMGGVFARALLRDGHALVPVLRESPVEEIAAQVTDPPLVLVTVGEADLGQVLAALPQVWRARTGLIQNELLPRTWIRHGVTDPTVAAVWFEKKPGRDVKVIIPTPVHGPQAGLITSALGGIGIPAVEIPDESEMLFELVRKNLYILTANIGGLVTKGTVHDLWYNNRSLAEQVAAEILSVQHWLTAVPLDEDRLVAGMVEAFDADPDHGATGRSAPGRLARALRNADEAGLDVPSLRAIAASQS